MRRINYLISWSERRIGLAVPAPSNDLRIALLVLGCSAALVVVLWSVQHARLRSAQRIGGAYGARLAAMEPALLRSRAAQRDLESLRAQLAHQGELRASGSAAANAVAILGNRLPDGAWLSALRADASAVQLEGRGASMETVGSAVARLATVSGYTATRLVSARAEPARGGVAYAISLERAR